MSDVAAISSPGAIEIGPGVHWVGACDPELRTFDIILKTANGTTYNAYAVRGDDGVAIIDTVKACFAADFFRRIESIARYDEIRAIVLNHLEPDHSGALPELLRRAPQARLYISSRGRPMLKGLLHESGAQFTAVTTGDAIDLGGRTLSFLQTPYLHWPDTQCTWLEDAGMLFSGDLFGCHYCDTRLFDGAVGDFRVPFEHYYACLMRPFRTHVLAALEILAPLPIRLLAPAHGPVLRDNPGHYLERYRALAAPSRANAGGVKTLVVFYLSAYGSTRAMAGAVAAGAEEGGGVRVSLHDLQGGEMAQFIDQIEAADGLLVGSPTINGDAVKPVWDLLSSLTTVEARGKIGGAFGSYGWTGEAVGMIEERLRGLKLRVPVQGVRARLIPTPAELAECRAFGGAFAGHLTGGGEHRIIDMAALA